MLPRTPIFFLVCLCAAGTPLWSGPSAIGIRYDETLAFAGEQAEGLADEVLNRNRERFVNYTTESGFWRTSGDGTWTSGFVPGLFWYLSEMTDEARWMEDALHWTEGARSRATATDNDTGFQIYHSFGLGHAFSPENRAAFLPVLLQGAETLVEERYNSTIGAFRSWDQNVGNPTQLPFEVNIDQMMNLELVLWAAANGGSEVWEDYAVTHADTTWEHNVREDGGTYHVVAYNLDGTVDYKRTHQGWTTDSTWSRGQAWAVYGYVMVYRYTGLPRMLDRARNLYNYFIAQTLEDAADYVPYSDFDAPLDSRNPRDASAAAIVASAAIELYEITGEQSFLDDAEEILDSLSSPRYMARGTRYESILRKASEKWGRPEVGAIFADFYLLEAMYRWNQLEKDPGVPTGEWAGHTILDNAFSDTGSWMGWMKTRYAPHYYNYPLESWMYSPEGAASPRGGWFYTYR